MLPNPDDRTVNEPCIVLSPLEVAKWYVDITYTATDIGLHLPNGLYPRFWKMQPDSPEFAQAKTQLIDNAISAGWESCTFHGKQAVLVANIQRIHTVKPEPETLV